MFSWILLEDCSTWKLFSLLYIYIYIYIYASLFTNLNKYIFSENISFYIVVVSLPLVICVLYMGKFTFVFVFSCNKKEITKRQSWPHFCFSVLPGTWLTVKVNWKLANQNGVWNRSRTEWRQCIDWYLNFKVFKVVKREMEELSSWI